MRLEQEWFRVWEDSPGIWVIEEPLHSEQVKSYLVLGSGRAALIDTGMGVGDIRAVVERITHLPVTVLLSHAHSDHIGGAHQFDELAIHRSEADDLIAGLSAERLSGWFAPAELSGSLPAPFNPVGFTIPGAVASTNLEDGDSIDLGDVMLEVLHLPGHSRGGLAFLDRERRALFSTDVVYLRQLYLLNPDSSVDEYVGSLARLATLEDDLDQLYPSHGPSPISPKIVPEMHRAMIEIQRGREPDRIEPEPGIDGGREDTNLRTRLLTHDFGGFEVLIAEL